MWRSGARRSCDTEYENASSSLLLASSSMLRLLRSAFALASSCSIRRRLEANQPISSANRMNATKCAVSEGCMYSEYRGSVKK